MPIDRIITASIQDGAVIPADLSTGAPSWDTSGNLSFNSGYGSNGVAYACRAWVNFNGTGTVAIRASGNVSSITDNNTGDYTVNFTTAMPDANYSGVSLFGNGNTVSVAPVADIGATPTTSAFRVLCYLRSTGAPVDVAHCNVAIFR